MTAAALTLATAIPATSLAQEVVTSTQMQAGDVLSDQQLNVVENYGLTQVESQSTGNSLQGGNETVRADVSATQTVSGNVTARATVTGTNTGAETLSLGTPMSVTTQAVGNYMSHVAQDGDAGVTTHQSSTGTAVQAWTDIQSPNNAIYESGEGDAVSEVNHQAYQVSNGRLDSQSWQASGTESRADVSATVHYSPSVNLYKASATNNSYEANSEDRGSQAHEVHQDQSAMTHARAEVYGGNMWNVAAQGSAVANNTDIQNTGGSLDVTNDQHQGGNVQSQAYASADEYGTADVSASGIGNRLAAGNNDVTLHLDNTQISDGGVDVTATFEGNTGYDSYISAEAYGNQALAYACAECKADANITSTQVNNGDVNATSTVNVAQGRSIVSSARAVGNSATYYVSGGH
ncbi:MAG: holdfast anchor protein HfaD [Asticcacaulis sp.]|nr:holdfast anchor protein HfaD [Asticcacaulis sp.]